MDTFLNTTTKYTHIEKGGIYMILYIHKMKHPDNGRWIKCVTYQSIDDNRVWTRSLSSFVTNFEDLNELNDELKYERIHLLDSNE